VGERQLLLEGGNRYVEHGSRVPATRTATPVVP
jgi:hypothetical protein